jgi:signal transduction histidine kinase
LTVGALLAALLLAVAVIFSEAAGATRIAEVSRHLNWTNSAAAAVGITRAATAQAVVFAVDRGLGVADDDAVALALAEAEESRAALRAWTASAPQGTDHRVLIDLAAYDDAIGGVLELVEQDRPVAADRAQAEILEHRFASASGRLGTAQQQLADEIAAAEADAGQVALTARTLVTFLIPLGAILTYRAIARADLRRRQAAMSARLEAAEELSKAKDEFIAGMSHELRTPLTGIYGFAQHLLSGEVADPHETQELLQLITSESAELSRMVEDLLTAGRLDADALDVAREPVEMALEVSATAAPLVRAGQDIGVRGPNAVVVADSARVRQILRNLLSNAAKHGGPRIEVSTMVIGDELHCTVSDSGEGVDAAIAPRLFDRFVHDGKATLLTGSVGLGLAISRALAERMSGRLTYERYSGWTAFTLTLPLADDQSRLTTPVLNLPNVARDAVSPMLDVTPSTNTDTFRRHPHVAPAARVDVTVGAPTDESPSEFRIRFE